MARNSEHAFFPVSGCKTLLPINSHHASVETSPICRENYFIFGEPIPPTSMIVVGKAKKKVWIYSPHPETSHRHHPQDWPRIPIVDSPKKKPSPRWKIWGGQPVPQRIDRTSELLYELATPWRHSIVSNPQGFEEPTKERLNKRGSFFTQQEDGCVLFLFNTVFFVGVPPKNGVFMYICSWKFAKQ